MAAIRGDKFLVYFFFSSYNKRYYVELAEPIHVSLRRISPEDITPRRFPARGLMPGPFIYGVPEEVLLPASF